MAENYPRFKQRALYSRFCNLDSGRFCPGLGVDCWKKVHNIDHSLRYIYVFAGECLKYLMNG